MATAKAAGRGAPARGQKKKGIDLLDRSVDLAPAPLPEARRKAVKLPRLLGAAIDQMAAVRGRKALLSSYLAAALAEEDEMENQIIEKFSKSELEGARGSLMQASISRLEVPTIEDDKKLYAHIKKTGHLDLLQRRLSSTAVRERWKAGRAVPGVGKFTKVSLSLTVIKK